MSSPGRGNCPDLTAASRQARGATGASAPDPTETTAAEATELTATALKGTDAAGTTEEATATPATDATGTEAAGPAKKRTRGRGKKARAADGGAEGTVKKPSALDAAAKVLEEAGQPMGCKELVGAMAAKGYWSSPGGKTPDATLYSAMLREITTQGEQARFRRVGRGQFARNGPA